MIDLALPLLGLLMADGWRRRGGAASAPVPHAHPQPTVAPAPTPRPRPRPQPAPVPGPAPNPPGPPPLAASVPAPNVPPPAWPSAVPSDLPPFPGAGWVPHPSPGRVASRASALLPQLWARGAGSHVIEQTAGEWVAYQAKAMGSKKGVVAYVPRASVAPTPASASVPTVTPRPQPAPAPRPRPPVAPALPPEIITVSTTPPDDDDDDAPATNRPTLTLGSTGAHVVDVQRRLGVTAKGGGYTGYYGTMTAAAVKKFQESRGLPADGIVGPSTWAALEGRPS